ncbi:hypothetical protein DDB_G0269674 [Dictyostelium discoideum AX4]|uniref:Uncharacterized protein n=1 Tax=Dictyostelium discoideum TaxID=44689 RepID=Q55DF8_DICDI|nr:hypothetical protein DDB_G0269674 [Dictyostelium discoideum AX4]EAL72187.1 hypothetical protein DDB_G0269674 [Dictyostelium discoideum AX4]|eukprot:XP_646173.1 hypothetical protein DDB_G0269674 [Dictyostelium discoideum AX4]
MQKIILVICLILSLVFISYGEQTSSAKCYMRLDDCEKMRKAREKSIADGSINHMPAQGRQLFEEIYANNCPKA